MVTFTASTAAASCLTDALSTSALVGLAKLSVLALKRLDPDALLARLPGAHALIPLGLLHPLGQRLARPLDFAQEPILAAMEEIASYCDA